MNSEHEFYRSKIETSIPLVGAINKKHINSMNLKFLARDQVESQIRQS